MPAGAHPAAFSRASLALIVPLSALAALLGVQMVTVLGTAASTAVPAALAAMALGALPWTLLLPFRSVHRQNLVQGAAAVATIAAGNTLLLPIGLPVALGRPDLVTPLFLGVALALLVDLLLAARLFATPAFPAEAAWPQGRATAETLLAGQEGERRGVGLLLGLAAGVFGAMYRVPMLAFGLAFLAPPWPLLAFALGLLLRGHASDLPTGWLPDLMRAQIPQGLLLGAALAAVAQIVVVAIRRRAEFRPALALAFAAHLAIAVLLALAGGLASRLGPGMLLLFVAYAALAAFVHLLVCGLAAMHTGWLPALALAMIALTIGLLIGFPPAALCLVTGFTAATGPAFAAFGHALATGHILREGTTEAFQQDGQRQQLRSALLAAIIAVAVVWLSHAPLFAEGRIPPMDHVYAIAIRAGTAPDVLTRMLPWAIAGAALQLAGGPSRQLGLLFATGLMLLNPAAGWALLAGLACREFARRRLPAATPQDLRSFAAGTIAGDALYGLYDSTWRLIAGRR